MNTPIPESPKTPRDQGSIDRLLRTFSRGMTVMDLARTLLSLDEDASVDSAVDLMVSSGQSALGVRRCGLIQGWISRQTLPSGGQLADHGRPFEAGEVVDEKAGIDEVLAAMVDREQIFVRWMGEVAGIVQRADLQKPAVRMWLFGVVTLLDSNLTWAIETLYPDNGWTSLVSEGRREKAMELCEERRRRGSNCRLVDCLQIKDKADVLTKDAAHIKLLGLTSRREAERLSGDIELLRNHLAHGQELESSHLATGARLAASLEGILRADRASQLVQLRLTSC